MTGAGCGSGSVESGVTVTSATPAFGSILGGSHTTLTGTGFTFEGAAPDHVLIGGHEAALAGAIDDRTLEVVVPPSDTPGDAEVVVFNHQGRGTATGIFHYSTPPTITSVTPGDVLYSTPSTVMTASGTGFQDEAAGFTRVQIDGVDTVDVQVLSDTQVKFTAFGAPLLSTPNITISNARGTGSADRAFRYVPSTHHGLILFTRQSATNFVDFYDPTDQSIVSVRRQNTANIFGPSATFIQDGVMYAFNRDQAQFGTIDFRTQRLNEGAVTQNQTVNAAVAVGTTVYAIAKGSFGPLDLDTGGVTEVVKLCCKGFGLAADASGNMVVTWEDQPPGNIGTNYVQTITPTGTLGSPVAIQGNLHTRDLRYLDGQLYALMTNRAAGLNNQTILVKLDPSTGTTTTIKTFNDRRGAMEVFQ